MALAKQDLFYLDVKQSLLCSGPLKAFNGEPNNGHSNNRTIQIADSFLFGNRMSVIQMAVQYSDAIQIADRYSDHHWKSGQFFVWYLDAI